MVEYQKSARTLIFVFILLPFTGAAVTVPGQAGDAPDSPTLVPYRAAATQYSPSSDWNLGAQGILEENFNTILLLARNASLQGADIIVLPEYGLTGPDLGQNRTLFKALCQVVPRPEDGRVPCNEDVQTQNYSMMQLLSCLALQLDMYIVVDLAELVLPETIPIAEDSAGSKSAVGKEALPWLSPVEEQDSDKYGLYSDIQNENSGALELGSREKDAEEDFIAYNSQVVFDRTGAVVARYRKKHLFFEPEFEYGNEDDSTALFTTDFGVTFTLQVCFDIMYSSPAVANIVGAGVRDVAMSTAWIDELPFLTAPQIFSGFSRGLSSNLIVSNLMNPSTGEMGSGIFHGNPNKDHKYTYDSDVHEPVLIVDDITAQVDGEMWMIFEEKQDLLATTLVKKMFESSPESESITGEHEKFLDRREILEDNLKSDVAGLFRNDTYSREVIRDKFSSMRKVSQWERLSNQRVCYETCKRVKFLLEQGKPAGIDHFAHPATHEGSTSMSEGVQLSKTSSTGNPSFNSKSKETEDNSTPDSVLKSDMNESKNDQFIIHENVSFYAHEVLPSAQNASATSCYDSFCCEVRYTFQEGMEPSTVPGAAYMLLAYNGTVAKGSGTYWMWTQVCGVVFCVDEDDVNSCAAVDEPMPGLRSGFRLRNITGNFQTSVIFPSVFDLNFQLVNGTLWSSSAESGQLLVQGDIDNLLTAVLFGRKYSLDP